MNYCLRYFSLLLALLFVGGGFSSCSNDDPKEAPAVPSFKATLGTVDPVSAELLLTTTVITEYAWVCVPASESQELTPAAIFATGTVVKCTDGNSTLKISDLTPVSDYIVYLAAAISAKEFYSGQIAPIEFKTVDFTDEITIIKRTEDGAAIRIRLPEEVVKRDNVIKWNIANTLAYNVARMRGLLDAGILVSNDGYYNKFFKESATLYFDDEHMVKTDENGEPFLNDQGEVVTYWDPIVPGEPLYVLLGEHEWGEAPFAGWDEGWYKVMFDYAGYRAAVRPGPGPLASRADVNEADFWSGYYKVVKARAAEPALLAAKIEVETDGLRPNGGIIRITPEAGIRRYCVAICDQASYEGQWLPMLDNNEEYLQWAVTSYAGVSLFNAMTFEEPVELRFEDIFYDLTPGVPYHICVTAMGDDAGMTQNFTHKTIELPGPTLPAPNIEVKAIKNPNGKESPYEAWFNIKSPDATATKVGYAANFLRDFLSALASGYTYADLIAQSRGVLTSEEVAKVNSSEGCNIQFNSRENAKTRLAVMAWNIEGTPSNPNVENSPAIADHQTIPLPDADRVESSLFQDLLGDWTATATVKVYKRNPDWTYGWVDIADPIKTKVSIVSGITYPETLPSEVYDLEVYKNMTKAEVDGLYAEFKESAVIFNSQVRGQNRLLCLGYDFDAVKKVPKLSLQTPYDLFVNPKYNAPLVENAFYDFGPKWYIQITKDNTAFVPVNMNRLAPLSMWSTGEAYHLILSSLKGGLSVPADVADMNNVEKWPNIPVEISTDKNTITLKKVVNEGEDLYPSVVFPYYGQISIFDTKVSSEVVLTRGWEEPTETQVNARNARNSAVPSMSSVMGVPVKSLNNGVLSLPEKPKSRTIMPTKPRVKYKKVDNFHAVTSEEMKANIAKFATRHNIQADRK